MPGFHATVGMLVPRRFGASDRTGYRLLTPLLREHGDEGHHNEPPGTSWSGVGFVGSSIRDVPEASVDICGRSWS